MTDDRILESAVGDIHLPGKKETIDTSIEFNPQNPFTIDIPHEHSDSIGNPGFPIEPEKAGFFESAKAEFKATSTNLAALHYADMHPPEKPSMEAQYLYPGIENSFIFKEPPPGWTSKQEIEKLTDVDPKFMPVLLSSRNPQDFQYRLADVYTQQRDDHVLENGSTFGKIVGGLIGYSPIGSIENWIPLTAIATKAKVASGFLSAAMKSAPAMLAASAIRI